jgi:hypothetical protein
VTNLIEVVFENIDKSCVMQLLALLILSAKNVTGIQCSEGIELFVNGNTSDEEFNRLLNFDGDISALINLQAMKVGDITLPNVLLRLVKYGDLYDIDFNFDSNELGSINMMQLLTELHRYAKGIALKYSVESIYAGMEPASDEDTRYFTDNEIGPLTLS